MPKITLKYLTTNQVKFEDVVLYFSAGTKLAFCLCVDAVVSCVENLCKAEAETGEFPIKLSNHFTENSASSRKKKALYFLKSIYENDAIQFNTSLPFSERVNDLVSRLDLEEIVLQMSKGGGSTNGSSGGPAPAIPRLGIGPWEWQTECMRGDAGAGNATSFPQSIGLAASFSQRLMYKMAAATSVEVRAKHNDFWKKKIYYGHAGLSCFSPVINIMRHPLWGRNQETYGEDPYLSGEMVSAFTSALRGSHPRFFRVATVCKHFDAYGGPENIPTSRLVFNANVTEHDLRMTFLPQFKACVEGGAMGVMCSYNSVNGVPACANKRLLTDILRKEWGFKGFVISDAGALEFTILNHFYFHSKVDAAAGCANAGVNLELPAYQYNFQVYENLTQAVQQGKVEQTKLVELVKPLFYTRMRLGEFDPPDMNPYTKLNLSVIQSPEHQAISLEAAVKSLVLLKNENNFLPLNGKMGKIAIIGPMANNPTQQLGDYSADVDPQFMTTPLTGLSPLGEQVLYVAGCNETKCQHYNKSDVINAVSKAELTFLCLGTGQAIETENTDRRNMLLPGKQVEILSDVIKYSKGYIVLLLFSGGPLDIRVADQSDRIPAILQCFFPAQATGAALYNVITMANKDSNPAARLPFTWYYSDEQVPSMTNYSMANRTYRYYDGDPLYPFGYGLSYTTFKFSDLVLNPVKVKAGNNVSASFTVTNTGPLDGDVVCQVYISWLNATMTTPKVQLVAFDRQNIPQGKNETFNFMIKSSQMALWVDGKGFIIEPGDIKVYAGGQLPEQKKQIPKSNVLQEIFSIYT
ncbi:hypothetical protein ScPMuIL_012902 [Solemya velum]